MSTNEETQAQEEVAEVKSEVEELESKTEEEKDTTDYKAKYEETLGRLKRAETKLDKVKTERTIEKKVEEKLTEKSGELDETALDFLDLKGITEPEDIEVIEAVVKRTGMTPRQALKDEYVLGKLEANKKNREVSNAIPSSSKRSSGANSNDFDVALARFEKDGILPDDFALRVKVVNARAEKENKNKPTWRR